MRVAERWTDKLGGTPLAFIHKTRDPLRPNEVVANRVVGEVEGRVCILVDDMIDTGGTIVKAAETLFEAGAADVIVTATHGVLSGPAVDRLKNSKVSEVIVTNTLPIEPERHFDKLTVLSIAPLLARAIKEVFEDGSVTSLFDGASELSILRTAPRPGAVPAVARSRSRPTSGDAAGRRSVGGPALGCSPDVGSRDVSARFRTLLQHSGVRGAPGNRGSPRLEVPADAEVTVETRDRTVDECARQVLAHLR